MTTKKLKEWADALYEKHGDVECFFRDENCYAYKNLKSIFVSVASGNDRDKKILVLDLPKKDIYL